MTGVRTFDSTVRLDVVNGSADHGRANLVITGRFQEANDAWSFGTAARTSLVFARNAADTARRSASWVRSRCPLQLEGNSRSLGVLPATVARSPR